MSSDDEHHDPVPAGELKREQSLADLEQVLGEREQLLGDRDQARIDHEQASLDRERWSDGAHGPIASRRLDDRQARLNRSQDYESARQESLDQSQLGRDHHQDSLDRLREKHNLPLSQQPPSAEPVALRQDAKDRAAAARVRAEAALLRAQAALARAEAAEKRAFLESSTPPAPTDP